MIYFDQMKSVYFLYCSKKSFEFYVNIIQGLILFDWFHCIGDINETYKETCNAQDYILIFSTSTCVLYLTPVHSHLKCGYKFLRVINAWKKLSSTANTDNLQIKIFF